MNNYQPTVFENRFFVELEEEDIQELNREEAAKFEQNPQFRAAAASVEERLGPGSWDEHWLTVDNSGRRVYARIYSGAGHAIALTADGKIVREMDYPVEEVETQD
ncbi:hypothetical protein EDC14_104922 [Hydrogenispora ethanolica]|uniref:Uncharacterized protein n=1 Tax=Hydrogenispora ethanolica TaxID=1082276 RepID=A0A4R1QRQ6_HYDET|nr:hypothetical protein [Hydrogenispora ethanolica]TCL56498.1 hypothetical protein EDC14_104922 [Hydrogenispora ethanolica]